MADTLRRRVRWAARCLMAAAVGGLAADPVQAFFFFGWPGDGLPRTPSLVPRNAPKEGSPPSAQLREERQPVFTDEGPPNDVPPENPREIPPPAVPEPMTLTLAGLGAGALVLARLRRRSGLPPQRGDRQ